MAVPDPEPLCMAVAHQGESMNVSELIEILSRLPADTRVVLPHFYGGFCDLSSVHPEPVRRVPGMSMADAKYEGDDPLSDEPFVPDEIVIVLDVENTTP